MICRGPSFSLWPQNSAPRPPPPPLFLFLSRPVCRRSRSLTESVGGGGGGRGAESYDRKKAKKAWAHGVRWSNHTAQIFLTWPSV
jgi:hypothetical protein